MHHHHPSHHQPAIKKTGLSCRVILLSCTPPPDLSTVKTQQSFHLPQTNYYEPSSSQPFPPNTNGGTNTTGNTSSNPYHQQSSSSSSSSGHYRVGVPQHHNNNSSNSSHGNYHASNTIVPVYAPPTPLTSRSTLASASTPSSSSTYSTSFHNSQLNGSFYGACNNNWSNGNYDRFLKQHQTRMFVYFVLFVLFDCSVFCQSQSFQINSHSHNP